MSAHNSTILPSTTGDQLVLTPNYIRYGNRVMDSSYIASVTVKKNRILFNNFKQNTSLPTLTVSFKNESLARHALNKCCEYFELCSSNPYYGSDDDIHEVFLPDAYGGMFAVNPEYLKYRDRVVGANEVRTVQQKGRRVLVNRYKNNHEAPTMCVHFADKNSAKHALDTIHSILWNISPTETQEESVEDVEPDVVLEDETTENSTLMSRSMAELEKPIDPVFLSFMTITTFILFILSILRFSTEKGRGYDEL
jgi:hypothetical protein